MKLDQGQSERLHFLVRVTHKESHYLQETDARLFAKPMTVESLQTLESDPVLAERLDAFVSWFGRLQDNLGDKMLPQLLDAMAEKTGAAIAAFGQGTAVWLFGSPVDDAKKGGDIDLLVSADAFPKQKQDKLKVTA